MVEPESVRNIRLTRHSSRPNAPYLVCWMWHRDRHALLCPGDPRFGCDIEHHVVVSGIGCSGRVAGYMNIDSYHTTHGRAIPFATGLKLANPDLTVTVFSGDGDLAAIGGNHLIHAARRNVDITVICTNNFTYGMTGGQAGPTTPLGAYATTTPLETRNCLSISLSSFAGPEPILSRVGPLHARQTKQEILYAFTKPGFVLCRSIIALPDWVRKINQIPDGLAELELYRDRCILVGKNPMEHVGIDSGGTRDLHWRFVNRDQLPYTPPQLREDSMRKRFAGFGGQGVGLAGYILGKALALHHEREAVMTQSYGPEARGGASVPILSCPIDRSTTHSSNELTSW